MRSPHYVSSYFRTLFAFIFGSSEVRTDTALPNLLIAQAQAREEQGPCQVRSGRQKINPHNKSEGARQVRTTRADSGLNDRFNRHTTPIR